MALFGSKKKTEKTVIAKAEPKAKKTAVAKTPSESSAVFTHAHVLLRPRITEKASVVAELSNAYTFEVRKEISKHDVAKAVFEAYKVYPRKITMTTLPGKVKFIKGRMGKKAGVKKAIVFLEKGDKIEFV